VRQASVPRGRVAPSLGLTGVNVGNGKARSWNLSPELDYKMFRRFSSSFALNLSRNINDYQWYGFYSDAAGPHYTFARLDQTTTSATVRLNYTFTPAISLQAYVQPFVSKGNYARVRQLSSTPRARDYDARFAPFDNPTVTNEPGGFSFKEFQSNLVFRWEYRPGSTLFVVWNEGRQDFVPQEFATTFSGDVRSLMALHPANTILVKMSYWLNR
jgi:hypothetical protein